MVKGMKPIFQEHDCLSEGAIQEYVNSRLSNTDRHRVENHMLDCPLCSDAVEGYTFLKEEKRPAGARVLNWRLFSMAAAALVLLAAAVWIYSSPSGEEALFAQYYESYQSDLDIQLRKSGESAQTTNTGLARGLKAYQAKDFSTAIAEMDGFLKENPDHAVARFYLGTAQMADARWTDAEQNLGMVRSTGMEYWEEASWYLALIYVKTSRTESAKETLEALVEPGSGRYYEKAKELLEKIN